MGIILVDVVDVVDVVALVEDAGTYCSAVAPIRTIAGIGVV